MELIFADLKTVEKRLEKVIKEAKSNSKEAIKQKEILEEILKLLENGQGARKFVVKDERSSFCKEPKSLNYKANYLCSKFR